MRLNVQAPRRPFWHSAAPIGFCLIAFLAAAITAGFVGFANSLAREERPLEIEAESVVALTGGSDRVFEAAGLLARRQARRLLITGVNPTTHEAALERILPISRELFNCCVDLGYQAQDTEGNARESREWMQRRGLKGPLIVVTSNYHMPRALLEPGRPCHPRSSTPTRSSASVSASKIISRIDTSCACCCANISNICAPWRARAGKRFLDAVEDERNQEAAFFAKRRERPEYASSRA